MNAEATVLKLYPLGENGLIVVWCTEEGIIRTAAKSARKPNSPFARAPGPLLPVPHAVDAGKKRETCTP